MLLDHSEIFVCPTCRPTQGLIVLVDELRDRRVVRGDLGCPSCEARYPVRGGLIRFDAPGAAEDDAGADPGRGPGSGPGRGPEDGPGRPSGAGGSDAGADPETRPASGPARPPDGAGGAEGRAEPPGGRAGEGAFGGGPREGLPGAELFRGVPPSEAAVRLAALLGLPEAEGPFLLFPGLGALAGPLAQAADGEEVLAVVGGEAARAEREGADAPAASDDGGKTGAGPGPDAVTRLTGVSPTDLPVFSGRLGGAAVPVGAGGVVAEAVRILREGARLVVVEPSPEARSAVENLPVETVAGDPRALVAVRRT